MTTITQNTILTQNLANNYSWPVTISENVTILLGENINISGINKYFIINGNNIKMDGNNYTITISNTNSYNGLIYQDQVMLGLSLSNYIQNTTIKNIGILSNNSNLADYAGWLCQDSFGALNQNVQIINCYSTGEINGKYSGGLFGYNCAYGGYLTIENCYTTGNITGKFAGGITGCDGCFSFSYDPDTGQGGTRGLTQNDLLDSGNDEEM